MNNIDTAEMMRLKYEAIGVLVTDITKIIAPASKAYAAEVMEDMKACMSLATSAFAHKEAGTVVKVHTYLVELERINRQHFGQGQTA